MKTKISIVLLIAGSVVLTSMSCKCKKNLAKGNTQDKNTKALIVQQDYALPDTNDPCQVETLFINGDILSIGVSYSGGCKEHEFKLFFNGLYKKSLPMKATLFLEHENHGDACRAMLTDTLNFNIKALRSPVDKPGEIMVNLAGAGPTVKYSY